nr:MAG TPA: NATURAL KILLER CELL PROTEASE 1 (serine protease-inhibitor), protease substrate.2A [Caudoviricetes sp.]DAN20301.1 MAG TPA: NATURAL KILLER CELL PROTEASE 1 (serine protease-inhibitor), protease substrate.2A [Caudoviricetes sp.]
MVIRLLSLPYHIRKNSDLPIVVGPFLCSILLLSD